MPWPAVWELANSAPRIATPRAPPAWRAALSMPLARPACSRPADPTTTAVMAGIASEHMPSSTEPAVIIASGGVGPGGGEHGRAGPGQGEAGRHRDPGAEPRGQ